MGLLRAAKASFGVPGDFTNRTFIFPILIEPLARILGGLSDKVVSTDRLPVYVLHHSAHQVVLPVVVIQKELLHALIAMLGPLGRQLSQRPTHRLAPEPDCIHNLQVSHATWHKIMFYPIKRYSLNIIL